MFMLNALLYNYAQIYNCDIKYILGGTENM